MATRAGHRHARPVAGSARTTSPPRCSGYASTASRRRSSRTPAPPPWPLPSRPPSRRPTPPARNLSGRSAGGDAPRAEALGGPGARAVAPAPSRHLRRRGRSTPSPTALDPAGPSSRSRSRRARRRRPRASWWPEPHGARREARRRRRTARARDAPRRGPRAAAAVVDGAAHAGHARLVGWLDNGVRVHHRFMEQPKGRATVIDHAGRGRDRGRRREPRRDRGGGERLGPAGHEQALEHRRARPHDRPEGGRAGRHGPRHRRALGGRQPRRARARARARLSAPHRPPGRERGLRAVAPGQARRGRRARADAARGLRRGAGRRVLPRRRGAPAPGEHRPDRGALPGRRPGVAHAAHRARPHRGGRGRRHPAGAERRARVALPRIAPRAPAHLGQDAPRPPRGAASRRAYRGQPLRAHADGPGAGAGRVLRRRRPRRCGRAASWASPRGCSPRG